ncbi:MAG: hypothetical protein J7L55_02165 [Desulfurococcales archaeon]|nr:hypothetical protein [Desulfurococcales archaeon]
MTLWFSYMVGPLGTSIRLRKAFVVGWRDESSSTIRGKVCAIYTLKEVNPSTIDGVYELARMDPDLIDVVEGDEKAVVEIVRLE